MIHFGYFRCENISGKGTHTIINMQRFGRISYNKHDARTAEKPLCLHVERQRDHIFCRVIKVT